MDSGKKRGTSLKPRGIKGPAPKREMRHFSSGHASFLRQQYHCSRDHQKHQQPQRVVDARRRQHDPNLGQ